MNEELTANIVKSIRAYDFESAQKAIAELFALDMGSSKPHLYLGIIHELKGGKGEAMRHFRAALALVGSDQVVLYNLYRLGDESKLPIRFE